MEGAVVVARPWRVGGATRVGSEGPSTKAVGSKGCVAQPTDNAAAVDAAAGKYMTIYLLESLKNDKHLGLARPREYIAPPEVL